MNEKKIDVDEIKARADAADLRTECDMAELRAAVAERDAERNALLAARGEDDEIRTLVETVDMLRARVVELEGRKAAVCEACRTRPGVEVHSRHACPECDGSGAVLR